MLELKIIIFSGWVFKTSYFLIVAVFQGYLFQGKNYIYVGLSLRGIFLILPVQAILFRKYLLEVFFFCFEGKRIAYKKESAEVSCKFGPVWMFIEWFWYWEVKKLLKDDTKLPIVIT